MPNKLKILIVDIGGRGGITHYTYNLSEALSKFEDVETILLTERDYELDNFPRDFRLVKIPIKSKPYFKAIIGIISSILKINPQIIHIQSLVSARRDWIFFILARLLNLHIIFTAHNVLPHDEFERMAKGMRFSFKSIYSSSRALITHSEYNKKELMKDFNIKDSNIFVVPLGNYLFLTYGRTELTKDLAREKLGLSPHDKVVLCFGAIREYKGIQYLIPAFGDVAKEIQDARLMIVGPPLDKNFTIRVNELIRECNIEKATIFCPHYIPLDEISLYFMASDIAVFPYLHTYGSAALHSAFAFSKPVIATDLDVFREMIKHGQNGYIIPPKDVEALAKAIVRCLSMSSDELGKMGRNSLHLAKTKYRWEAIAKSTINVYKNIVG